VIHGSVGGGVSNESSGGLHYVNGIRQMITPSFGTYDYELNECVEKYDHGMS